VTSYAGPRQLRRLLGAVMAVAYETDLPAVLEHIVEAARELVGARYAALGVLDPTRTHLAQFITVGLDDDQLASIGALPEGHGLLGVLISDPHPLRLPNLAEHPDSFGFPPGHPPMRSFLGVPICVDDEVFGNLYLTDKDDDDGFSDIDEELALSLAGAAGLAIERARRHERDADRSLVEARERIGRDLHDTVLQQIFATGLALHGTARLVADRPQVAGRVQEHIDALDHAIRDLRSAIFKIESATSTGPSLRRDILGLGADAGRILGFEPSVLLDGPLDTGVSDAIAAELLPVLREALSNIARHAAASAVAITVRIDGTILRLRVDDDGIGMPSDAHGGNGLRNITQRAQALGGHTTTHPGIEHGTTLDWSVPLAV
jgi:signal transduction histidine kinase